MPVLVCCETYKFSEKVRLSPPTLHSSLFTRVLDTHTRYHTPRLSHTPHSLDVYFWVSQVSSLYSQVSSLYSDLASSVSLASSERQRDLASESLASDLAVESLLSTCKCQVSFLKCLRCGTACDKCLRQVQSPSCRHTSGEAVCLLLSS